MKEGTVQIKGITFPLFSLNTLIIGSGAAALNAALNLRKMGQEDIAIATDRWGGGTSNNAGSDKQTYYKLSLSGEKPDSVRQMAEDLFSGGCMHGDIALCEAQDSLRTFFHLVTLGVPFPHDRYGAFAEYRTDHDVAGRATSAGPLTSRLMFQALAAEVRNSGILVMDNHEVIALLTRREGEERHVIGAVALDTRNLESAGHGLVLFNATNVVLGTGGPGGMYESSVYPEDQLGSTGMALEIGAVGHNLTESQFGLASISFRWNVSGSYQQVIPRYLSTDSDGGDENEFLNDFFPDIQKLTTAIFLKGYEWPFDPGKIAGYGSSLIDLLVCREKSIEGRRVFLDFTRNPTGPGESGDFSFEALQGDVRSYLESSNAISPSPIERLESMNPQAVELYRDHGIDLSKDYLEIAVCTQHNNGGLKGNIWWESNIRHLFPVGEVNGSHGVRRPGGAALNSGQVGGLRAALYISRRYDTGPMEGEAFMASAGDRIGEIVEFASRIIDQSLEESREMEASRKEIEERMSRVGAHIRDPGLVSTAVSEAWDLYSRLREELKIRSGRELPDAFKSLDLCLTHALYLEAINEYLEKGGKSRGSYLVLDRDGEIPCEGVEEEWKYSLNTGDGFVDQKILEISLMEDRSVNKEWVDVRPIPQEELWFESLWQAYRDDEIIR